MATKQVPFLRETLWLNECTVFTALRLIDTLSEKLINSLLKGSLCVYGVGVSKSN